MHNRNLAILRHSDVNGESNRTRDKLKFVDCDNTRRFCPYADIEVVVRHVQDERRADVIGGGMSGTPVMVTKKCRESLKRQIVAISSNTVISKI
jgi:hypothetical protein